MIRGRRTLWRALAALVLLLLAAGLTAPLVNANRFGRQIRDSLQNALGRQVEIRGAVRLDLFNGPGFSVTDVLIHEDPRISLEPLVYVGSASSMEARISLSSLWTGRLRFSHLRLNEPSINLVKPKEGPWNFEPLLVRTVDAAGRRSSDLPGIEIRGGRVNFKFGDLKSVYYFTDAEIEVSPPSGSRQEWNFRFSGAPARTDRSAQGFGRLSGSGRWLPDLRTGGSVDFSLRLERSPLGELIRLVHGHDIGVHGEIASSARLKGPVTDIHINGRAQISDIHRWDLLPPHGEGWPLDFEGRLDLVSQRFQIETAPAGNTDPPFSISFSASDYLSRPRWDTTARLNGTPAAPLVEVARHMGVPFPDGFGAEGDLAGVIGYSAEGAFEGKISAPRLTLKAADSPPLELAPAEVVLEGTRARLLPARLLTADKAEATVRGAYEWSTQRLEGSLETPSMQISALRSGAVGLLGAGGVPVLENCGGGVWNGELRYRAEGGTPGEWTGTFQIEDADVSLPGIAAPLVVNSARVVLRGGGAVVSRLSGRLGQAGFQGEYRYRPDSPRPHQFNLSVPALDAAEFESAFLPTLRRRRGFLARALRFGRAEVPAWLAERHADGRIQIGSFLLGSLELRKVRAHVRWDAAAVELTDVDAHLAAASLRGNASINLRRGVPVYRLSLRCDSFPWSGGEFQTEALVQTAGVGADLLRNLRSEGSFNGRSFEFDKETGFDAISGSYTFSMARSRPSLQFAGLQATVGADVFQGQGATRDDGSLYFELSDGQRQMRMAGTLWPFQVVVPAAEVAAPRP